DSGVSHIARVDDHSYGRQNRQDHGDSNHQTSRPHPPFSFPRNLCNSSTSGGAPADTYGFGTFTGAHEPAMLGSHNLKARTFPMPPPGWLPPICTCTGWRMMQWPELL